MKGFFNINVPFIPQDKIREQAEIFRNKYWGNEIPVDVDLIAENLGMDIIPLNEDIFNIIQDSSAFLSGSMTKIYYKQKDSEFRIRFSIAHELGHFSLHKEIFENINITNNEDWKKIVSSIPRDKWSALEYQANEFAGSLLVPGKELIKDIYATSNLDVEKYLEYLKIRGYDSTLEGYLIKNLAEIIHRKYEVTSQVIEIRIQREKLDLEEFLLGIK